MRRDNREPRIIHRSRRGAEQPRQTASRRGGGVQKPGLLAFVVLLIYKNLYILGVTMLRRNNRFRRISKRSFNRLRGRSYARLEAFLADFANIFRRIWARIRAPFIRIGLIRRQVEPIIARAREEGKIPFKAYGRIIASWLRLLFTIFRTIFNYAAPAAMVFVLFTAIETQLNKVVGLDVYYADTDTPIGFIQYESDFEYAADILRGLYISEDLYREITPRFKLREPKPGEGFTEPSDLAASMMEASGGEVAPGFGLYIDGEFYGAVADSGAILDELTAIRTNNSTGVKGEEVEFVKDIAVTRQSLYPKSSVVNMDEMRKTLYQTESVDEYYTVEAGDSLSLIASKTGVPQDTIIALNDGIEEEGVYEGDVLLLSKAQPFLQVLNIYPTVYEEEFPYDIEEVPTGLYAQGYYDVEKPGVPGVREVNAKIHKINNVEVKREIIATRVVKEPVTEVVTVGIHDPKAMAANSETAPISAGGFMWPTQGGSIGTRLWGYYNHTGVDIPRPSGTPIYASRAGVVVRALNGSTGYGRYIILDHGDGYATYYAHCSLLYVTAGDKVKQGDVIGLVGRTGNSTGNHLHFEVRFNNQVLDPADFIGYYG
ncbi:MAG: M23 family metallopeptidase [Oscillospiraceae bacterium]|jgi:murein DD-endopeptidase MepM/ murein hydrolase activator NlpD|nr:M23 family metallopeptidase [Oscillospiraceae bacterium]